MTKKEQSGTSWHAIAADEALERLDSRRDGLSGDEARRRLEEQGRNRLTPPKRRTALRRLLAQFGNTLVLVLLAAAAVMVLIGELLDAAVVGGVVLVNALIGFVQEGRAERALEAVRDAIAPEAEAVRGGERRRIPAEELVRGDIVCLKAGDVAPADLRLVDEKGLEIQEAALTGESAPVGKSAEPVEEDAALAERASMAWSGTVVARGTGSGIVAETGDSTQIGRIGRLLAQRDSRDTPLARQMSRFSGRLTLAILALAASVFAVGFWIRDMGAVETFRAAVGLAIAAVPEALPAILTITMAVGVTRMARRKAIIRKLPAVETLGSVDIICADKTGTITCNQLTVRTAVTADGCWSVAGAAYAPEGRVEREQGEGGKPEDDPLLEQLAWGALLANDARLRCEDGEWKVEGDLTDGALLAFAAKAGLDPEEDRKRAGRIDSVPYEGDRQFSASLNDRDGERTLWLKGAPETVLGLCEKQAARGGDEKIDRDGWEKRIEELAGEGQRLLAVARRPGGDGVDTEEVEKGGFVLVGIAGMIDPARPEAKDSIETCRDAGIAVKMITGDHAETARSIAASVGLEGDVVTGPELDEMDDAAFDGAAREATIFARVTPEHKQRLIGSLQACGSSIAMTGDGFNDAPALQKADVGVAMGGRGTEAARQASDMVLTDDNFASIVAAVHEGRTVYDNLRKAIAYILPTSFGEAALIILAVAVGAALPITALQILWINLVTEATLSVSIAFDPPEPDIMKRKPRKRDAPLLSAFLVWRIGFVALLMMAGGWILFRLYDGQGSIETARTMVVNALVAFEIAYLFNCRRLRGSALTLEVLTGNRAVLLSIAAVIALQMLFTYAGFMNDLFGSAPLGLADWGLAALAGLLLFLLVEAEKPLTRRWWRAEA